MKMGSAIIQDLIRVDASALEGEVQLLFFKEGEIKGCPRCIFSAKLEIDSVALVADACAKALARSDWPELWVKVPNPNAYQEEEQ